MVHPKRVGVHVGPKVCPPIAQQGVTIPPVKRGECVKKKPRSHKKGPPNKGPHGKKSKKENPEKGKGP